jgi:hypothetical protein
MFQLKGFSLFLLLSYLNDAEWVACCIRDVKKIDGIGKKLLTE